MALLKCKMCGGDITPIEGSTVCDCEYCGTRQTVPSLDNEKKLALFQRANKLRFNCEFDKAYSLYETIIVDYPEEAEAYWGLVLCKYGIEYVDDPATGKKVPTCHRSSFESIFDDSNYQTTLEYADLGSRVIYKEEANAIEEIRKGIIEISSKEEPYDIFICYKETDPNGDRTIDSVLAEDVYDALTSKGYRVFFSRITLEDKLGVEYEPYIFSALHSSRIMLAFGTDCEYYNAVWVKNEWSRFLKLIEKDKKKVLIPCYKGIDAYDIPKEFARLQAQDMGKVGAIQDLLRGIEKILPRKKKEQGAMMGNQMAPTSDFFAPILKRANAQLANGSFDESLANYRKVLEFTPDNEEAIIGEFLSKMKSRSVDELKSGTRFFHTEKAFKELNAIVSDKTKAVFEDAYACVVKNNIAKMTDCLENAHYDEAGRYARAVLLHEPENDKAQIGKFLSSVSIQSIDALKSGEWFFLADEAYEELYSVASEETKATFADVYACVAQNNVYKMKQCLEAKDFENAIWYASNLLQYEPQNENALLTVFLCDCGASTIEEVAQGNTYIEGFDSYLNLTANATDELREALAQVALSVKGNNQSLLESLIAEKQFDKARVELEKIQANDPENEETLLASFLIECKVPSLDALGETKEIIALCASYDQCIKTLPEEKVDIILEKERKQRRDTLALIEEAIQKSQYDRLEKLCKRLLTVEPENEKALLGLIYVKNKVNSVSKLPSKAIESAECKKLYSFCSSQLKQELDERKAEIKKTKKKTAIISGATASGVALMCILIVIIMAITIIISAVIYLNSNSYIFMTENTNNGVAIVGYRGYDEDVEIPSKIAGKKITAIDYQAFYGNTTIKNVVIEEGIEIIGDQAFYNCTSLTSVTIGNSVTSIGYDAFSGCTSLTSIVIPDSVTNIGGSAFCDCDSLTIYCEATSKPIRWNISWNFSKCPVVWGYTGE